MNVNCWHTLWTTCPKSIEGINKISKADPSSAKTSLKPSAERVNWLIVKRGGLASITGLELIPSSLLDSVEKSMKVLRNVDRSKIDLFTILLEDGSSVEGLTYYPDDWDKNDKSRCILYHNPNGATVAHLFENGKLSWTPGDILQICQCPIILYDYRGTGLSKDSFSFYPTYESIIADGVVALNYALKEYSFVEVWGSSLGGGVATASLDNYLQRRSPEVEKRVSLINHDSFTSTSQVAMPKVGFFAEILGTVLDINIDAKTSISSLIDRGIKVTVLGHLKDPVIPPGTRMVEYVNPIKKENLTVISSPLYGHANLSQDMIQSIKKVKEQEYIEMRRKLKEED